MPCWGKKDKKGVRVHKHGSFIEDSPPSSVTYVNETSNSPKQSVIKEWTQSHPFETQQVSITAHKQQRLYILNKHVIIS